MMSRLFSGMAAFNFLSAALSASASTDPAVTGTPDATKITAPYRSDTIFSISKIEPDGSKITLSCFAYIDKQQLPQSNDQFTLHIDTPTRNHLTIMADQGWMTYVRVGGRKEVDLTRDYTGAVHATCAPGDRSCPTGVSKMGVADFSVNTALAKQRCTDEIGRQRELLSPKKSPSSSFAPR